MENQNQTSSNNLYELEVKLTDIKKNWNVIIEEMSKKLCKKEHYEGLMVDVYSYRQCMIESYYNINNQFNRINNVYKKEYQKLYDFCTNKSQVRFTSETAKKSKIDSDLADLVYKMEMLESHMDFLKESIKSVDSIMWAAKNWVEFKNMVHTGVI